jgi:hypothetical protein
MEPAQITDMRPPNSVRRYYITFPGQPGLSGRWVSASSLGLTVKQAARTAGEALVKGERQNAYGDPDVSFNRIAKLWTAHLGTEVTKRDVALMMILMKVSREKSSHKADNLDDIEGYVYCARLLKEDS